MSHSNGSIKVFLASKDSSVIETTQQAFLEQDNLILVTQNLTPKNLPQALVDHQPDLMLLDFESEEQPFYLAYKLSSQYPMYPIVAILPKSKIEKADRVGQVGVNAYVQYPFPNGDLVDTIKNHAIFQESNPMRSNQTPVTQKKANHSHTFTIFSPKGGTGCTTIATNLAISLHKTLKEEVLLIDGKHLFGHVALYLNLLSGNSITDLIAHAGMLDQQLVNQVVLHHKSGIHVLPSPNSIDGAQGIKPESLFEVLKSLKAYFPNIIVDAGNYLNENSVTYMDASDKVLLVLNPDLASLRDTRQFIEISSTLSYPKEKLCLLLNLIGRKEDVRKEEIEKILKTEITGRIPADEEIALSCLNEGVPLLLKKPRHPISKAISEITECLVAFINAPVYDESQIYENGHTEQMYFS